MRPDPADRTRAPAAFRGASPPLPPEAIVGIDPGKVLRLAGALDVAADRAGWLAGSITAIVAGVGEDAGIATPLRSFARWCSVERPVVRGAAEAILALEGRPPPGWLADLGIRHSPDLADFADPVAAVDAAESAAAAIAAHEDHLATELIGRWSVDAVFAAVLIDRIGAAAIGEAVDHLAALTGSGLDDERRAQERLVVGLAASLATARRTGGSDLSVSSLRATIPSRSAGELGLLLLGPTVFDTRFLAEAVAELVESPVGVAVDDGVWVASAAVEGERDARDSTSLVLQALARNPAAATRVLLDADLQRLLVDTPYRDGGDTLAQVLDVGTDPRLGDPLSPRAAVEVIAWVADRVTLDHGDLAAGPALAAGTHTGLGQVAAHYIGSFRSDHHDGVEVDPVSDQLRSEIGGQQADRFLVYAARREHGADVMRAALVDWAANGVASVARHAPVELGPFTVIGDVGRRVSDAVELASVSWAAVADRRRAGDRYVWDRLVDAVSNVAGSWDPSNTLVSSAGSQIIDRFLPAGGAQLEVASRGPRTQSGDQLRLQQVAAAVLWEARSDNHLFDGVPPPPELLDGTRLRSVVEVDEAGAVERFDGWLAELAEQGVGPLDRLGSEFGSTGVRPAG